MTPREAAIEHFLKCDECRAERDAVDYRKIVRWIRCEEGARLEAAERASLKPKVKVRA